MCAKILSYVTYVSKYQKTYMKRHTSYLAVLLTIFPELVFIQIELKIANSAKAKIEVSFKKKSIPWP